MITHFLKQTFYMEHDHMLITPVNAVTEEWDRQSLGTHIKTSYACSELSAWKIMLTALDYDTNLLAQITI